LLILQPCPSFRSPSNVPEDRHLLRFPVSVIVSLCLNFTKEAGGLELSLIGQPKSFFFPFFGNLLIHDLQ